MRNKREKRAIYLQQTDLVWQADELTYKKMKVLKALNFMLVQISFFMMGWTAQNLSPGNEWN